MLELFPASSVSKLRAKRWKYWGAKLETNLNQFSSLQCKIVTIEPSKCLSICLLPQQLKISIHFV